MAGLWLARAGFPSGSRLAVTVKPGRLVVTVVAPPAPPAARQVCESDLPYCLTPEGTRFLQRMARRRWQAKRARQPTRRG